MAVKERWSLRRLVRPRCRWRFPALIAMRSQLQRSYPPLL